MKRRLRRRPRTPPKQPDSRVALVTSPDILDHLDVLDDDKALCDQLIEFSEKRSDARLGVDDDDGHGQVIGEREDARRVNVVGRAKTLDTTEHRCFCEPGRMGSLNNLGRQRRVAVTIGLANKDREPLLVALQLHAAPPRVIGKTRASTMPIQTARKPASKLPSA